MGATLNKDELDSLKSFGVIAQNWYAVCYDKNSMPIAIFQNEDHAKMYRNQFSATSIIEPWPMVIKDYRK